MIRTPKFLPLWRVLLEEINHWEAYNFSGKTQLAVDAETPN
jgi:hypothetical protein